MVFRIFHGKVRETVGPVGGPYNLTWERQELPDPGAQNYAFKSQLLPPYTPIGPTQRAATPFRPLAANAYHQFTALTVSTPTSGPFQGQVISQPLMEKSSLYGDYVVPAPAFGTLSSREYAG